MLGAPSEDTSSSKPKTSMLRSRSLLGSRRLVLAARSRFAQPRSTGRPLRHSFFCVDRPARCLAKHPPECPCQVTSCTPSRTNAAPHLAECSDGGAVALASHHTTIAAGQTMAPGVRCISMMEFYGEQHRMTHNEESSQYVQDRNIRMR